MLSRAIEPTVTPTSPGWNKALTANTCVVSESQRAGYATGIATLYVSLIV